MDAGKTFEGLPMWAKGGIAVGALALSTMVGFTIYNKMKQSRLLRDARKEGAAVDDEIAKMKKDKNIVPSLSQSQFESMANALKTAFDGIGTTGGVVERVFNSLKNEADILQLIKTYGIREINSGIYLVPNFKGTLSQALTDEIQNKYFNVNDVNKILSKKGIKFQF